MEATRKIDARLRRLSLLVIVCIYLHGCGGGDQSVSMYDAVVADEQEASFSYDGMVFVDGGKSCIGCQIEEGNECLFGDEWPRVIDVAGFAIDACEVSVLDFVRILKQYDADYVLVEAMLNRYGPASADSAGKITVKDVPDNIAMYGVTLYGACMYCNAVGKRLCTISEFEVAGRGLNADCNGSKYVWGNEEPTCEYANFYGFNYSVVSENECGHGAPVSCGNYAKDVSLNGVYDLAGNVEEWVVEDRANDNRCFGYDAVTKGGSFMSFPDHGWPVMMAFENSMELSSNVHQITNGGDFYVGFRCCRSL